MVNRNLNYISIKNHGFSLYYTTNYEHGMGKEQKSLET